MPRRLSFVMISSLCASVVALLVAVLPASAHNLEADYRVLPGGKVEVESWFDLTGKSPHDAEVKVLRADGSLLTHGRLDDKGLFVFSIEKPEPLRVVVSAGAGHRKELQIGAAILAKTSTLPTLPTTAAPAPFADRRTRVSIKDILLGITCLFTAAAFFLGLRNARRLRALEKGCTQPARQADTWQGEAETKLPV